jgi:ketopantoate reductase
VDALTGAVVRRAVAHGIDIPVTRTVDALVRWVSDQASGGITQPRPAGADSDS